MKLTKLADYAVRAVVHLASVDTGAVATTVDIAEANAIPGPFLAKVMQALARGGLVHAHRGKGGGFSLLKNPHNISIRDIVEAVEGPIILNRCVMRNQLCERDVFCGAHPVWIEAQEALVNVLDSYSVAHMAERQKANLTK